MNIFTLRCDLSDSSNIAEDNSIMEYSDDNTIEEKNCHFVCENSSVTNLISNHSSKNRSQT